MLTVQDVAQQLQVSPQCVYALIEAGRLATHRIGVGRGTIRVSQEDLSAYLATTREQKGEARRKRMSRPKLKHISLRPSAPGRACAED